MPEPTDPIVTENAVGQTTLPEFDGSEKTAEVALRNGVRLLSDVEKAWLAGVVDGEGSIFLSKLTHGNWRYRRGFIYVPALKVSNSNRAFSNKVRDTIGKGSVNFVEEKRSHWKDRWDYTGSGLVLRGLLPQILPHMLVKREVAQRMLEYLSFVDANPIDGSRKQIPPSYYDRLDSLYLAVKRLNERGKNPSTELSEILLSQPHNPNKRGPGSRTSSCRQMREEERAWLAGVIDGEGSIFLSKVTHPNYRRGFFYRPQLEVSNSNRLFLIRVAEIVGEGTVQLAKKEPGAWKTRWMYAAVSGVLRVVLPQIVPYMIIKRAQAETMLKFLAFIDENLIRGRTKVELNYYEKLDSLYRTIKKLNEKGRQVVSAV